MIPRRYITEWKAYAPWPTDAQVEQDLVIERALIALFSDPFLKEHVAFPWWESVNQTLPVDLNNTKMG